MEKFKREVGRLLTGERERTEGIALHQKGHLVHSAVIEQAFETAGLMLCTDKLRKLNLAIRWLP